MGRKISNRHIKKKMLMGMIIMCLFKYVSKPNVYFIFF